MPQSVPILDYSDLSTLRSTSNSKEWIQDSNINLDNRISQGQVLVKDMDPQFRPPCSFCFELDLGDIPSQPSVPAGFEYAVIFNNSVYPVIFEIRFNSNKSLGILYRMHWVGGEASNSYEWSTHLQSFLLPSKHKYAVSIGPNCLWTTGVNGGYSCKVCRDDGYTLTTHLSNWVGTGLRDKIYWETPLNTFANIGGFNANNVYAQNNTHSVYNAQDWIKITDLKVFNFELPLSNPTTEKLPDYGYTLTDYCNNLPVPEVLRDNPYRNAWYFANRNLGVGTTISSDFRSISIINDPDDLTTWDLQYNWEFSATTDNNNIEFSVMPSSWIFAKFEIDLTNSPDTEEQQKQFVLRYFNRGLQPEIALIYYSFDYGISWLENVDTGVITISQNTTLNLLNAGQVPCFPKSKNKYYMYFAGRISPKLSKENCTQGMLKLVRNTIGKTENSTCTIKCCYIRTCGEYFGISNIVSKSATEWKLLDESINNKEIIGSKDNLATGKCYGTFLNNVGYSTSLSIPNELSFESAAASKWTDVDGNENIGFTTNKISRPTDSAECYVGVAGGFYAPGDGTTPAPSISPIWWNNNNITDTTATSGWRIAPNCKWCCNRDLTQDTDKPDEIKYALDLHSPVYIPDSGPNVGLILQNKNINFADYADSRWKFFRDKRFRFYYRLWLKFLNYDAVNGGIFQFGSNYSSILRINASEQANPTKWTLYEGTSIREVPTTNIYSGYFGIVMVGKYNITASQKWRWVDNGGPAGAVANFEFKILSYFNGNKEIPVNDDNLGIYLPRQIEG